MNESGVWFFDESKIKHSDNTIDRLPISTVYLLSEKLQSDIKISYFSVWNIFPEPKYQSGFWLTDPEIIQKNNPSFIIAGPEQPFNISMCKEMLSRIVDYLQNRIIVVVTAIEKEYLVKLFADEGYALHENVFLTEDLLDIALSFVSKPVSMESICGDVFKDRVAGQSAFRQGECFAECVLELINIIRSKGLCSKEEIDKLIEEKNNVLFKGKLFSNRELENLPGGMGVYGFKDSNGTYIYIAGCTDLRKNINSYFNRYSDSINENKQIQTETVSFDAYQCGSELECIIFEYRLLKKYRPVYNKTASLTVKNSEKEMHLKNCIIFLSHSDCSKVMTFWIKSGRKTIMKSYSSGQLSDETVRKNLDDFFNDKFTVPGDFDPDEEHLVYSWIEKNIEKIFLIEISPGTGTMELFEMFKAGLAAKVRV